jgi:hypothetical protein
MRSTDKMTAVNFADPGSATHAADRLRRTRNSRAGRPRALVGAVACMLVLAACSPAATSADVTSPAPASAVPADARASANSLTGLDGVTLRGVAAFDGGVLAVGSDADGAAAWTSQDGVAWEPATVEGAGAAPSLVAVAFAESGLAFGGDDLGTSPLWTSGDGVSWRPAQGGKAGPDGRVNAVVADGSGWIAAGDIVDDETGEAYNGAIWTSADGRSWEVIKEVSLNEGTVSDIAVAGETAVVVGFDVGGGSVWTSTGGGDFEKVPGKAFAVATIQGVATVDEGFVALGRRLDDLRPVAWTSPDGMTWTREEIAADAFAEEDEIHDLATVDDRVFAVGTTAAGAGVWTSRDGRSWSGGS